MKPDAKNPAATATAMIKMRRLYVYRRQTLANSASSFFYR
jgi:hypothetical protein